MCTIHCDHIRSPLPALSLPSPALLFCSFCLIIVSLLFSCYLFSIPHLRGKMRYLSYRKAFLSETSLTMHPEIHMHLNNALRGPDASTWPGGKRLFWELVRKVSSLGGHTERERLWSWTTKYMIPCHV